MNYSVEVPTYTLTVVFDELKTEIAPQTYNGVLHHSSDGNTITIVCYNRIIELPIRHVLTVSKESDNSDLEDDMDDSEFECEDGKRTFIIAFKARTLRTPDWLHKKQQLDKYIQVRTIRLSSGDTVDIGLLKFTGDYKPSIEKMPHVLKHTIIAYWEIQGKSLISRNSQFDPNQQPIFNESVASFISELEACDLS